MLGPEQIVTEDLPDTAARYAAFRKHISFLARINPDGSLNVPGDDPLQLSGFQAIEADLEAGPNSILANNVETAINLDPERSVSHLGFWLLRSLQDSELRQVYPEIDYTEGLEDPDEWLERPIARLGNDPNEQVHFWMNYDLKTRTNFPQRGVLVKLATMMLGYRDPVYMLDVGCSRNHVAKKLAYPKHDRYSYDPVTVMRPTNDGKNYIPELFSPHFWGALSGRELPIASIVGIDIQDLLIPDLTQKDIKKLLVSKHIPEDLKQHFWSRNNLYPSEYRHKKERVYEYSLLDSIPTEELPNVRFFKGDVTNFDSEEFEHEFPELPKADIAYLLFSGYQIREEGVTDAIENLQRHMKPDGKILIFDHMEVKPDGSIEFLDHWAPWTASMAVLDLSHQEAGFRELFKVRNGRAAEIMLTSDSSRRAVRRLVHSARSAR